MRKQKIKGWRTAIALLCMLLLFSSSFVYAVEYASWLEQKEEKFEEQETGETLAINVISYQPPVIPSKFIEDRDITLYGQLAAVSLGSLFNIKSSVEPLYGNLDIERIRIKSLDAETDRFVKGVNWIKANPLYLSQDNLGYVAVTLKQMREEAKIPDIINLNFTAEIWFKDAERLFTTLEQSLILYEYPSEDEWRSDAEALEASSFFGRRGFIRLSEITADNTARLTVYSGDDLVWPYTGTPRPIADIELNAGDKKESSYYRLNDYTGLQQDAFRVKFDGTKDPEEKKAKLSVNINGMEYIFVLAKGMKVYPGSSWTIENTEEKESITGTEKKVTIKSGTSRKSVSTRFLTGLEEDATNIIFAEDETLKSVNLKSEISSLFKGSGLQFDTRDVKKGDDKKYPLTTEHKISNEKTLAQILTALLSTKGYTYKYNEDEGIIKIEKSEKDGTTDSSNNIFKTEFYVKEKFEDVKLSELQNQFETGSTEIIKLDFSETANLEDTTREYKIKGMVPLSTVLTEILPRGYEFAVDKNKVKISKTDLTELCASIGTLEDEKIPSLTLTEDTTNPEQKREAYCSSINEFKKAIQEYPGAGIEGQTYARIGQAYEALADTYSSKDSEQLNLYNLALDNYKSSVSYSDLGEDDRKRINDRIFGLQEIISKKAKFDLLEFTENGRDISIKLLDIERIPDNLRPKAVLEVDGAEGEYYERDHLYALDIVVGEDEDSFDVSYYLEDIKSDKVTIKSVCTGEKSTKLTNEYCNKGVSIDIKESKMLAKRKIVYVKDIQTFKAVQVTILPGTGRPLQSIGNFSMHIPIEKRAIKLSTEQMSEQINKTKQLAEKVEKITETMRKVITNWRKVCFATFAVLSLKNFGSAKTQARHLVMRGVSGNSGWREWCESRSKKDYKDKSSKDYQSYDECIMKNADKIEAHLEAGEGIIEGVNSKINSIKVNEKSGQYDLEGLENEEWHKEIMNSYKVGETAGTDVYNFCTKYLGGDTFFTKDELKNYVLQKELGNLETNPDITKGYSFSLELQSKIDSGNSIVNPTDEKKEPSTKIEACKKAYNSLSQTDKFSGWKEQKFEGLKPADSQTLDKRRILAWEFYNQNLADETPPSTSDVRLLDGTYFNINYIHSPYTKEDGKAKLLVVPIIEKTANGQVEDVQLQQLTIGMYKKYLEQIKDEEANGDKKTIIEAEIKRLEKDNKKWEQFIDLKDGRTAYISIKAKNEPADNAQIFISDMHALTSQGTRTDYDTNANIELTADGKPRRIPICNGEYIEVKDYYSSGEPRVVQKFNVGSDGLIGNQNDVPVSTILNAETAEGARLATEVSKEMNRIASLKQGMPLTLKCGKGETYNFGVQRGSASSSNLAENANAPSCYDTMSPDDCKILFNVCDPVMCPPSRFNLMGRWQVDDVVQTGIIGSLVLGQGNGDVFPVCATGILAGLENFKTYLDAYVECLESAKYEGTSVGICDKIFSLYWCQLIVQEGAAIFKTKGGLLDFLAGKILGAEGEGGGEYNLFESLTNNIEDSFNFFTKEYAQTAFAAFRGRSTQEIGGEICQQAIYAKGPLFERFFEQISEPESPPQIFATMDVMPWSSFKGKEEYAYSVYYHIFAGKSKPAQYRVYLKSSLGTRYPRYITDSCSGTAGYLEKGEAVDKQIDCVIEGQYDNLCIEVNGEENCGFSKVSTGFGMNYLNDLLVNDEAKREIDSEEECYPKQGLTSPALGSLVLPTGYQGGLLATGVRRVCSLENPGAGTKESKWTAIGTCGKDSLGRYLGYCWMDMESVNLNDAMKNEQLKEWARGKEIETMAEKKGLEIPTTYDKQAGEEELKRLEEIFKQTVLTEEAVVLKIKESKKASSLVSNYRNFISGSLSSENSAQAQFKLGEIFLALGNSIVYTAPVEEEEYLDYVSPEELEAAGERGAIYVKPTRQSCDMISERINEDYLEKIKESVSELTQIELIEEEDKIRIIAGIIAQESQADPNAESPTGCKGIMQFCSGAAYDMGLCKGEKKKGYYCAEEDNREDPFQAIPAGAKLLNRGIKTIKEEIEGDGKEIEEIELLKLGIAAYNGGAGVITSTINEISEDEITWEKVEEELKPEFITYFKNEEDRKNKVKEIRNYVPRVLAYADCLDLEDVGSLSRELWTAEVEEEEEEEEKPEEEPRCGECGFGEVFGFTFNLGAFDFNICEVDECHQLRVNDNLCYYIEPPDCKPCKEAEDCSDFSDDKEACEESCGNLFDCEYKEIEETIRTKEGYETYIKGACINKEGGGEISLKEAGNLPNFYGIEPDYPSQSFINIPYYHWLEDYMETSKLDYDDFDFWGLCDYEECEAKTIATICTEWSNERIVSPIFVVACIEDKQEGKVCYEASDLDITIMCEERGYSAFVESKKTSAEATFDFCWEDIETEEEGCSEADYSSKSYLEIAQGKLEWYLCKEKCERKKLDSFCLDLEENKITEDVFLISCWDEDNKFVCEENIPVTEIC